MQVQSPLEQSTLWRLLRRNLAVIIFLVLAAGGMIGIHGYFSPAGEGAAEAVSIAGAGRSLSAPISKPVASRPVKQRFAQTKPPLRIALIVGHRGNDSGAVCEDGLTELAVNTAIAEKAVILLENAGYAATLFDEFDPQLHGFEGTLLVSVHADSCADLGSDFTGFKVAGSSLTDSTGLVACLEGLYGAITGLPIHANTVTTHMTDYHVFREIGPGTPAAIIETGFLFQDRELLENQSDLPAEGIANGILCFMTDQ